jgi:hypothetical protein
MLFVTDYIDVQNEYFTRVAVEGLETLKKL